VEIFKTQEDTVLDNLTQLVLLEHVGWTGYSQEVRSNLNLSVILWSEVLHSCYVFTLPFSLPLPDISLAVGLLLLLQRQI